MTFLSIFMQSIPSFTYNIGMFSISSEAIIHVGWSWKMIKKMQTCTKIYIMYNTCIYNIPGQFFLKSFCFHSRCLYLLWCIYKAGCNNELYRVQLVGFIWSHIWIFDRKSSYSISREQVHVGGAWTSSQRYSLGWIHIRFLSLTCVYIVLNHTLKYDWVKNSQLCPCGLVGFHVPGDTDRTNISEIPDCLLSVIFWNPFQILEEHSHAIL